jgi:hypothetical protein
MLLKVVSSVDSIVLDMLECINALKEHQRTVLQHVMLFKTINTLYMVTFYDPSSLCKQCAFLSRDQGTSTGMANNGMGLEIFRTRCV